VKTPPLPAGPSQYSQYSGGISGDVFNCDATRQYLGTTAYGDVYEFVIDADRLKNTPPKIVLHAAYDKAPVTLFENAVLRVTLQPDKKR
jgi:hypothetical protein